MIQSFFVEGKPVSWNRIATQHWRVYQRIKDDVHQNTAIAILQTKIKKVKGPVKLSFEAHYKGTRLHDVDNLFCKAIIDQLVSMSIIEADDWRFVKEVRLSCKTSMEKEGVLVTISSTDVL